MNWNVLGILSTIGVATVMNGTPMSSAAQTPPKYYEEEVAASNPLRAEQARELDAYILKLKSNDARLRSVFNPDYRSPKAFEASTKRLRQAFAASIGYPPPGEPDAETPEFTKLGEDTIGVYYRAKISVLPGVHAEGI